MSETGRQLLGHEFPFRDEESLKATFGDPERFLADGDDSDWRAEILHRTPVTFPSPLRLAGTQKLVTRTFVHRRLLGAAITVFDALSREGAWKWLQEWGGCYNFRLQRGGTRLSLHSWAAAFDFNPTKLPLGVQADPRSGFVQEVVPIFERNGWTWGGRWSRPDGMHFEAVRRNS